MRIHGVHGIWSDGSGNVDRLLDALASKGYATNDVDSAARNPFSARFNSAEDAFDLVRVSRDGDVVIAHSYGCMKATKAMEAREYSAVYLFRPAMEVDYEFADNRTRVTCIHSKDDLAILAGQLLRFRHPFGNAGRVGFSSERAMNIKSKGGHSADFKGGRLQHWAAYIHNDIQWHTQK
jgi:hypothetical protein